MKGEASFAAKVAVGDLAARIVAAHLELCGHRPRAVDRFAFSAEIDHNNPDRGWRKPDIQCGGCPLKVEARWKRQHMVAMSDSSYRPFERELGIDTWVAFVTPGGIRYVRVSELVATRARAELKRNGDGEPYLVWPKDAIRASVLPDCHAT